MSSFNLERYWKYLDEKRAGAATQSRDGFSEFRVLKSYDLSEHKTHADFLRASRQYNVDLVPKLLFSKSKSVDLIIKSGVSNYLEF